MSKGRMDIPDGKLCKDCASFSRCSWLVGAKADWTSCDFSPHRFQPACDAGQRSAMNISVPTMVVSCPHCRERQRVPIPVADGTDPWPCEACGRTIQLPRVDFFTPASKDGEAKKEERAER